MSGYGVAADRGGNVLFVTGNSDFSGNTYDGVTNIQESVVKVSNLTDLVLVIYSLRATSPISTRQTAISGREA